MGVILPEHLIVVAGGAPWAIPIAQARECHPLPMLHAAAPGGPPDVVGFIDVRGALCPVLRPEGRPAAGRLSLHDAVVVLDTSRGRVALLVEAVSGMRRLRSGRSFSLDETPLAVLDAEECWRDAVPAAPQAPAFEPDSDAERIVFASRARTLAAAPALPPPGAQAVLLVEVAGRAFAVALDRVRAFVDASRAVPIPGAPPHVRGDVNVRGEIVTLFDAREPLGFDASSPSTSSCALVLGSRRDLAGFLVDRVGDIVYLKPGQFCDLATWNVDAMLRGEGAAIEEVSA